MIAVGDYISFSRVIRPPVKGVNKDASGKRHEWVKQEACWIDQSGSGQVDKINKTKRKLGEEAHVTARVDAGPLLGKVTVSIDDAVLVGVQQGFDLDIAAPAGPSMYGHQSGDHQ